MMTARPDDGEPDALVEFDLGAWLTKHYGPESGRDREKEDARPAVKLERTYLAVKRLKERARDAAFVAGKNFRCARIGEVTLDGDIMQGGIWRAAVFFDLPVPE